MSFIITPDQLQINEFKEQSFADRYKDYSLSSIGTVRTLKAIKDLYKLKNATSPSELTKTVESNIGTAIGGMGLVRIIPSTKDAFSAVKAVSEEKGDIERKVGVAIRDVTDAIASVGNATSFLSHEPVFRGIANAADLVSDSADLAVSYSDWSKVSHFQDGGKETVKNAIEHTRNYYWLRTAKAFTSVVAAILSLGMIFSGMKVLAAAAITFFSVASNFIAIRRDLLRTEGEHRLIQVS